MGVVWPAGVVVVLSTMTVAGVVVMLTTARLVVVIAVVLFACRLSSFCSRSCLADSNTLEASCGFSAWMASRALPSCSKTPSLYFGANAFSNAMRNDSSGTSRKSFCKSVVKAAENGSKASKIFPSPRILKCFDVNVLANQCCCSIVRLRFVLQSITSSLQC